MRYHKLINNTDEDILILDISRKGLPCAWEWGGGWTSTGEAVIIANKYGGPKKPIYIRRRGHLANDEHALFAIQKDDLVIIANHHRGNFTVCVKSIENIRETKVTIYGPEEKKLVADLKLLHTFSMGKWDVEPSKRILTAVEAAKDKSQIYHCREPIYFLG